MAEIWDFSNLLENWNKDASSTEGETREFPEVQTQLNTELAKLQQELDSLNNPSSTTKVENNFLTIPLPPLSSDQTPTQTPRQTENLLDKLLPEVKNPKRKIESALNKRPKPIAQLTKPIQNQQTKIVKPREPFQLHPMKQIKPKVIHKFDQFFRADPPELKLINFKINTEYIFTFIIQNITSNTKGFQLRGPTDKAFKFKIIEEVENTLIRPGLHLTFEVIFYPEEPRDYESQFLFIPGPDDPITTVPIRCFRDPPSLSLPDIVDLNSSLVFSSQKGEFTITNNGGFANFSFQSKSGRTVNDLFVDGPFTLWPSTFELGPDQSITIEISFSPKKKGKHKVSYEIVAQHFPQKFYFISQGEAFDPTLKFSICDESSLFVPFLPKESGKAKIIEIKNITDVEYPFHIQQIPIHINETNRLFSLYPEYFIQENLSISTPFTISPMTGRVRPNSSISIRIAFNPIMFSSYATKLHVFADKIPTQEGNLISIQMLTIDVEASSGTASVQIQPPLVIFNRIIPRIPMTKEVELLNQSFLTINLQWRKSDLVTPNPVVFEIEPTKKAKVLLNCLLLKKISQSDNRNTLLSKHQPELEMQAKASEVWHISSSTKNQTINTNEMNSNPTTTSTSHLYTINFNEKEEKSEEKSEIDIKRYSSCFFNQNLRLMPSMSNLEFMKSVKGAHYTDEVSFSTNSLNELSFTYTATIHPPLLDFRPSSLEFGCVLTGETATKEIVFTNKIDCPIGFRIEDPNQPELKIRDCEGFVVDNKSVFVDLHFDNPAAVEQLLTVTTFWCDDKGNQIESLPSTTFNIPIIAIFDRPIVQVKNKVIDIGNVFPTLEYEAKTEIELLNLFPTVFEFIDASYSVELSMPEENTEKVIEFNSTFCDKKKLPPSTKELRKENSTIIDIIEQNGSAEVYEYTKTKPEEGQLDPQQSKTASINLIACFSRLGDQALPFICKIIGRSYRCAIIAHVQPPKVTLITDKIDFSNDFVICNKSHSFVKVENECGVASTVQVRMIDNCNNVFSLDNRKVFNLPPFGSAEIPVSCYSEIHGDYYGKLKLIIKDPWQYKEIEIPMHVKALGSFFGFQKHTLGYTVDCDGDFISFGEEIKVSNKKVIRRLTLVNFSSESITVDWSISNFVKGRKYANVSLDIDDDGLVTLDINETEDANKQDPFKLLTSKSIIESHGKAVVVVEFNPEKVGEYGGCVAARSGEFIHTLGLHAIVI